MSNYKSTYDKADKNNSWTIATDFIKDNSRVLEVGSGNGNFSEVLKNEKNCHVTCIEPDTGDAKLARKKSDRVINDTIENSIELIKKEKFDHIIFMDVIEHLVDPVGVLSSLRHLLNKDGSIVFSLPNMGHISVRLMLLGGEYVYGETGVLDKTHLYFYTDKHINKTFNDAGYQVEDIRSVVVDYSDDIIKEELKKIGITKTNNELIKTLRSKNSHAYQYAGYAKVSKSKKPKSATPFNSPQAKFVIQNHLEEQIKERDKVIKDQHELILKLTADRNYYEDKLKELLGSKSWKMVSAVKKHIK